MSDTIIKTHEFNSFLTQLASSAKSSGGHVNVTSPTKSTGCGSSFAGSYQTIKDKLLTDEQSTIY